MHFCPSCQTCLEDNTVACPSCGHSEGGKQSVDPLKEAAKQRQLRKAGLDTDMVDIEGEDNSMVVYGAAGMVGLIAIWVLFF